MRPLRYSFRHNRSAGAALCALLILDLLPMVLPLLAVAESPEDPIDEGNIKKAQGNFPGAIDDYTQVLALDPKNAAAYSNRGNARHAQGDLDGANADYRGDRPRSPTSARLHKPRESVQESNLPYGGGAEGIRMMEDESD